MGIGRSSAFTAGPEGLSQAVLSICVMSADLVASLQIFDVMQIWQPYESSKMQCLTLSTENISSWEADLFQTVMTPVFAKYALQKKQNTL